MAEPLLVVLVTGGRDFGRILPGALPVARRRAYAERDFLRRTLERIHKETPIGMIVCGACMGADYFAAKWAFSQQIKVREFPALWRKVDENTEEYDPSAGPRRNQEMVDYVCDLKLPKLCAVFPGGAGTDSCKTKARAAGIPVREFVFNPGG